MGLMALLTGCAGQPCTEHLALATSATAPQPHVAQPGASAWVAAPSADLPQGFPPPGPVGQIMVKNYPAYRAAVATAGTGSGRKNDALFFLLFKHIQRHDIPMSAPVEMQYAQPEGDGASARAPASMAFIYGRPAIGQPGPDGAVQVVDVAAQQVVSIAVRGSYTAQRFWTAVAQLQAWLDANKTQYRPTGQPRYLAYNSPFVLPFMRSGEVQIPIVSAAQ